MKKEYNVPDEIHEIWCEYTGCLDLRDRYTKLPFGYKKAKKLAKDAEVARYKFWWELKSIYPELETKELKYEPHLKKILVQQPKETK